MTSIGIDGLDPLSFSNEESEKLIAEANKRIINNILKSYTGYYDGFSELIQNALDATENKFRDLGDSFTPKVWIYIDIEAGKIRVVDNGTGLSSDEFKYFLKPNVSFKRPKDCRGQKGVGATFLAYGFSFLRVHTRNEGIEVAAIMRQGRQWAQDQSDSIPRPVFEEEKFNVPELGNDEDGTSVEILITGIAGEKPGKLDWIGARTAEQWLDLLRIKTPLGGVYLHTDAFSPEVHIQVRDANGDTSKKDVTKPEYYYPHEMPVADKVATVKDIEAGLSKIQGSSEEKFSRLPAELKRLDALWEIYPKQAILDPEGAFASSSLTDEHRSLIERHNVVVYASFFRSAKLWNEFNEQTLKLRPGVRVIHGGLQMASDFMVQGDLSIIPLTSTIGYQANSHVIVHFTDGSPDMGRKVFQPELKELAEILAVRCVTVFKRYLQHLKPDTGATIVTPDKELHEWKKSQEILRDKSPLSLKTASGRVTLLSEPQQEQDVIALYHQLIGLGVIKGIDFLATSQSDRYDSLYILDYADETFRYSKSTNPLGVNSSYGFPHNSEPRVLEYKYDLDALVREFANEVKFANHINLVVCWQATKQFSEKFFLNSLLVGDEGSGRQVYAATHQAYASGSQTLAFEVCILSDLLRFIQNPADEEARQKTKYKD
ncbi:ATP-binding protein [Sphingomicrobium nitratireducens]|uniref:ATP-binding protein n=1 Tax=Sphingomicrobium nitratireducens TaxID=2964666 RepID=UPI0022403D36|nr:ATP-binding protein [Sphingomicrobium nitratireducens]